MSNTRRNHRLLHFLSIATLLSSLTLLLCTPAIASAGEGIDEVRLPRLELSVDIPIPGDSTATTTLELDPDRCRAKTGKLADARVACQVWETWRDVIDWLVR